MNHVAVEANGATHDELRAEVQRLRKRVAELERSEAEWRRSEETLTRQALVLQLILENLTEGVSAADVDGNVFIKNTAARDLAGYNQDVPPDEWVAEYGIFRSDQRTPFATDELPYVRAMRGEAVDHVEMYLRNPRLPPEGRWLDVTARPLRDAQGNLFGGLVVLRDVTRFKQEQLVMREKEERFRLFMDNSPTVAFMKDEQGRFVYYNQPHCVALRHGPADWLGKTVFDVYPAEFARTLDQHDRSAMAGEVTVESHELVPVPDGAVHEWLVFKFPIRSANGERYLGGVALDITNRLQAERALRESEERFRSLSACSPVGIFLDDPEGRCTYVNPRYEAICGRTFEEIQGFNWLSFIHPDDRNRVLSRWTEAAPLGRSVSFESRRLTAAGNYVWVHVQTAAIYSDGGVLTGHIGTVQDVTDRKLAEAKLQNYAGRLQALSRRLLEVQEQERRHLARELHDEIGQLLTGLKLTLEMSHRLKGDEQAANLREAQALVKDLTAQVRDLSLHLRPTMLDDLGLLPALLWLLERFTAQTQIHVDFEKGGIDRRFPPEVETAAYRIVQEALTNVARHAHVSRASLWVWLDGNALHVQVEDQGVGFDSEKKPAAASSSGLSGMDERATLLGGWLRVEAAPGQGTCILASLPTSSETRDAPEFHNRDESHQARRS